VKHLRADSSEKGVLIAMAYKNTSNINYANFNLHATTLHEKISSSLKNHIISKADFE
jgi:hypothetical protein